jgi:AraC-like DNA-binding protein
METPAKVSAPASFGMSSIRLVWPFLDLEQDQRRDTAARLGLTPKELDDPDTRVSQKLLSQLLRDTIARTGERDLGLLAARRVDSLHLGITHYIARTVPTLAAAITMTERYLPLLGDGVRYAIERKGKRVFTRLAFDPQLEMHEAAYEFALASWVLWARRIPGLGEFTPLSVHFMHARPANIRRHQKLFGCPVHFGAEATMLVVAASALEAPLSTADPVLAGFLEPQADAMLERLPRNDALTDRVRAMLAAEHDLQAMSLPQAARRFGMSVRTLTRKLSEEGAHFSDLLAEVRRAAALRELEKDSRPIAEIAARLGFASTPSFHRAFRRWTGTTADQIRREARAQRAGGALLRPAIAAASATIPRVTSSRRGVIRLFDAREITRFWSFEKYTLFSMHGEEHMSEEPLSALEDRLAAHGFLRIHRAELVRVDAVRALRMQAGIYDVELSDGQYANVSRRSLAAVKCALGLTV